MLMHPLVRNAFHLGRYFNLVEVHRSAGDLARFLTRVRTATSENPLSQEEVDDMFNDKCTLASHGHIHTTADTTFICSHHCKVDHYNNAQLRSIFSADELIPACPHFQTKDACCWKPTEVNNDSAAERHFANKDLHIDIIAVTARVRVTANVNVHRGVSNGTTGVITSIDLNDAGEAERIHVYTEHHAHVRITRSSSKHGTPFNRTLRRKSFPLSANYACTVHSCQGRTVTGRIVLDIDAFATGLGYVAISRATDFSNITIVRRLTPHDLRVVDLNSVMNFNRAPTSE